jgi:hypothetical protein
VLPRAVQTQYGVVFQTVDFAVLPIQGTAGASGIITLAYDPIDPAFLWRVERITVQSTSANQLTLTVKDSTDTTLPIHDRDWTPLPSGFKAVSEYPAFLTIPGGQQLVIYATGAAAGDVVTAVTQYQLVQRVPGGS